MKTNVSSVFAYCQGFTLRGIAPSKEGASLKAEELGTITRAGIPLVPYVVTIGPGELWLLPGDTHICWRGNAYHTLECPAWLEMR